MFERCKAVDATQISLSNFFSVWHLLASGACIVLWTTLQLTKLQFKIIGAKYFALPDVISAYSLSQE